MKDAVVIKNPLSIEGSLNSETYAIHHSDRVGPTYYDAKQWNITVTLTRKPKPVAGHYLPVQYETGDKFLPVQYYTEDDILNYTSVGDPVELFYQENRRVNVEEL